MPQFTSENQPKKGRGKSERTKIIEAMGRQGKTESGFYDHLVTMAFDVDNTFAYKELLQRMAPLKKAVLPNVSFDLDKEATPQDKAAQILTAISESEIPPDIGIGLINAIRNVLDIEANTELKAEIERIKDKLGLE